MTPFLPGQPPVLNYSWQSWGFLFFLNHSTLLLALSGDCASHTDWKKKMQVCERISWNCNFFPAKYVESIHRPQYLSRVTKMCTYPHWVSCLVFKNLLLLYFLIVGFAFLSFSENQWILQLLLLLSLGLGVSCGHCQHKKDIRGRSECVGYLLGRPFHGDFNKTQADSILIGIKFFPRLISYLKATGSENK